MIEMKRASVDFGQIIKLPQKSYTDIEKLKEDFSKSLGAEKSELHKIDIVTALDSSCYICCTKGNQRNVYLFDASEGNWMIPFHSSEGPQDKLLGIGCSDSCENYAKCTSEYRKKFG